MYMSGNNPAFCEIRCKGTIFLLKNTYFSRKNAWFLAYLKKIMYFCIPNCGNKTKSRIKRIWKEHSSHTTAAAWTSMVSVSVWRPRMVVAYLLPAVHTAVRNSLFLTRTTASKILDTHHTSVEDGCDGRTHTHVMCGQAAEDKSSSCFFYFKPYRPILILDDNNFYFLKDNIFYFERQHFLFWKTTETTQTTKTIKTTSNSQTLTSVVFVVMSLRDIKYVIRRLSPLSLLSLKNDCR